MSSKRHKVLLISYQSNSPLLAKIFENFDVIESESADSGGEIACDNSDVELIITHTQNTEDSLKTSQALSEHSWASGIPVLVLSKSADLQDKLKSFEMGCDDYVSEDIHPDELVARAHRIIFDKIANDQLKTQVQMANQAAFQAMANTSDLGTNIQFFLGSVECQNLDQLGLLMLQTTMNYGVKCSLQIRSKYELKNMEANGMPKEMESNLLMELKDAGRYYDFGTRSVMNYEQVSLLVKNMPVENQERYGQLKDNLFSLLQALDARVKALDNLITIDKEHQIMIKLVSKMHSIMDGIDQSFGAVMKESADIVEYLGEQIDEQIQFLGLTEDQESVLETAISEAIEKNQQVFSKGLKLNESLGAVIRKIAFLIDDPQHIDIQRIAKMLDAD